VEKFFIGDISGRKVPRRMDNSCTRLLGTLMKPSTSTMSAAFCFSTLDAFDPPLNPPTLSIHYALIPSTPIASLPTSPYEPCRSSLSLIPPLRVLSPMPMAVTLLFLSSDTITVTRNYAVKEVSGRCRENIQLRL